MNTIKNYYRKHSKSTAFIVVCFFIFWPLSLYLMWRHGKWSVKSRSVITALFASMAILVGVAAYNAPPSVALLNESAFNASKTDNDSVILSGDVASLHPAALTINGKQITLDSSNNFNYKLPLDEGDNKIGITVTSDKGTEKKLFTIHRTTKTEFAEQQLIVEAQAAEKKRLAIAKAAKDRADAVNAMQTCNGTTVMSGCKLDGTIYKTYVYHPAVPEKNHTVTDTTYKEVVTGYCTRCADGSLSPTCATGRGACSWHGGVSEWNAPVTRQEPVYTSRVIVDSPTVPEYYDKVVDSSYAQ